MTRQAVYWSSFDFTVLENAKVFKRNSKARNKKTLNNLIITADTETSRKRRSLHTDENHICAWSIAFKLSDKIYSVYGRTPSEMTACMNKIVTHLKGQQTYIFFHNLAYDYVFLRKFLYKRFGLPEAQLATRPHYPVTIEFENGIILRDSLIVAQRSLERWADDLGVDDKKAIGKWSYTKRRDQSTPLSSDEIEYITKDVVTLVECIDAYLKGLNKTLKGMPLTATGIVREEVRQEASQNRAKQKFDDIAPSFDEQMFLECVYHGGLVHGNRYYITDKLHQRTIKGDILCYDFKSSYPYCLIAEKYPMERFRYVGAMSLSDVLELAEDYAIMGTLMLTNVRIKEGVDLPVIQWSKCDTADNVVGDNGRILAADLIIIKTHELRMLTISEQYDFDAALITDARIAMKGYLPKWLRDYIFRCFREKCELQDGDPILYALSKSRINSVYGLHVQKPIQLDIVEDYETGEYEKDEHPPEEYLKEKYDIYLHRWGSVLPYQWGCWCTAWAERNLILLSRCFSEDGDGVWLYSDTDSAFGINWDEDKLKAYNENVKQKLLDSGYGPVVIDNNEYWLGIAELDKHFTEFRFTGAKRYCGRDAKTGELKITVAGVPKGRGAKCLKDDISKFSPGFRFRGIQTKKKQHEYIFVDDIYIDADGNETGDSINLTYCDYKLDCATVDSLEDYFEHLHIEEIPGYEYEYFDESEN